MFPRYRYPAGFIKGLVRDALLQRSRDFAADARVCAAHISPPLHILGSEYVPARGCYVITLNHYYRHGFASQWSALAVSSVVPAPVHWIMTGELTFPGNSLAPAGRPVSRFVLRRLARLYGFTTMPPMPPRPGDIRARTVAVRRVLRYATQTKNAVVGLAPEGGDQPGERLAAPPSGLGRFCLLLAAAGLRFLPAGIYEKDGRLCLSFGEPHELQIPESMAPDDRDQLAARLVMSRVAALLPQSLQGDFGG